MSRINIWPFGEHRQILVAGLVWKVLAPEESTIISPEKGGIETGLYLNALGHYAVLRGPWYRWTFAHLFKNPYSANRTVQEKEAFKFQTGNPSVAMFPHCCFRIVSQSPLDSICDPFEVFTQEIIDSLTFLGKDCAGELGKLA